MNPDLHSEVERVWRNLRPALRRRRFLRRGTLAGTTSAAILAAVFLFLPRPADQAPIETASAIAETTSEVPQPSLAVLVIDSSGTRFQEFGPGQLAGEGLLFDLNLEPVIAGRSIDL